MSSTLLDSPRDRRRGAVAARLAETSTRELTAAAAAARRFADHPDRRHRVLDPDFLAAIADGTWNAAADADADDLERHLVAALADRVPFRLRHGLRLAVRGLILAELTAALEPSRWDNRRAAWSAPWVAAAATCAIPAPR